MSEVQAAISRNVGVLRAVRGLRTDESVASILGVSVSTVNKKMSGARKWNLEEVETLAAYFRIPPNRLLGDPSELLDPNLEATGTSGKPSTTVRGDGFGLVIPFPQVAPSLTVFRDLAEVIPLARSNRDVHLRPSRSVSA